MDIVVSIAEESVRNPAKVFDERESANRVPPFAMVRIGVDKGYKPPRQSSKNRRDGRLTKYNTFFWKLPMVPRDSNEAEGIQYRGSSITKAGADSGISVEILQASGRSGVAH